MKLKKLHVAVHAALPMRRETEHALREMIERAADAVTFDEVGTFTEEAWRSLKRRVPPTTSH